MLKGRLLCAGLVLTVVACTRATGQQAKSISTQQLYLIARTSTPNYSTEAFPANLYQVRAGSKLKLIREVIPQKDGFIGVYAAGDVLFLPNLEGAVSIIHTNNPGLVDEVVFDTQPLIPLNAFIVGAESPGMGAEILIPIGEPPTDPPTPLKGKLVSISSTRDGAAPRIRLDAWDEYKAARFDGQPGGPVRGPIGLWGTAAGNDLAISLLGHSISVDALPPSFRGGKDRFSVLASSQRYVLLGRIPPRGEEHPQKTWDVFVHDRMRDNWKTIQEAEGPSRLFGPWLATRAAALLQNAKPSPGREKERNYGTPSLPNVRDEYENSVYNFWRSGDQILQNLEDGREIHIETNQEDSEILTVAGDTVLYRVNDAIYQARIVGDKLQDASVVVKDEDVPEIHWVFWGPPVQSATATDSAAPSGRPAQVELNEQGLNLMKRGDYKNASAKFLEAISLEPKNAMYADNAGFAFYKMGDYENAIKYFKMATDLDPKRAVAYLNLGDAYVKANHPADARQAYKKYLELAPNSKSVPDVKKKLEALPPVFPKQADVPQGHRYQLSCSLAGKTTPCFPLGNGDEVHVDHFELRDDAGKVQFEQDALPGRTFSNIRAQYVASTGVGELQRDMSEQLNPAFATLIGSARLLRVMASLGGASGDPVVWILEITPSGLLPSPPVTCLGGRLIEIVSSMGPSVACNFHTTYFRFPVLLQYDFNQHHMALMPNQNEFAALPLMARHPPLKPLVGSTILQLYGDHEKSAASSSTLIGPGQFLAWDQLRSTDLKVPPDRLVQIIDVWTPVSMKPGDDGAAGLQDISYDKADVWLQVSVNGRTGWINGDASFRAIGLPLTEEDEAASQPQPQQPPPPPLGPPTRIKQGGNVTAATIINQPPPYYPDLARRARIQGNVVLHAVIDKDGKVAEVQVLSGHPLLVQAAIDAVRQWRYAPTMLNGNPVEVDTTITVPFTLSEGTP